MHLKRLGLVEEAEVFGAPYKETCPKKLEGAATKWPLPFYTANWLQYVLVDARASHEFLMCSFLYHASLIKY